MTLALLLTAVTGAWADDISGTISWTVGNEANGTVSSEISSAVESTRLTTGNQMTIGTANYFNTDMVKYTPATANAGNVSGVMIEYTIEAVDGYKFKPTGVEYAAVKVGSDFPSYSWSYTIDGAESAITDVSKDDVLRNNGSNSATAQLMHSESITADGCSVFTLRFYISNCGTAKDICIGNITISGSVSAAEAPIEVKWDAATKTGTFEMPAYDVELTPLYAPVAQWAKVENVDQLPTAIEGIFAESTDAIVKAGTVAKIGETENLQGTLMYAVGTSATEQPALTAFSATLPTAEKIAAGDVYVWYYIKGADTPQGQTATAENTFNDSEICATPIKVTVLNNKFDIQFNAANANTIEAGKATVTVGGTAATVTEGKLQGVKMGSEVKVKANTGYKFRKVEVKKKSAFTPLDNTTTAWTAGPYAVPAGGLTYSDAITVSGDVTLVLTDGETLTLNKGISLASGATLTIQGNGTMNVSGTNESTASTVAGSGTITLTSGTLTAKGGNGGDGGAEGGAAINGTVIVDGGTLTATGGNGGNVGEDGVYSGGGAGGAAISGSVTVNSGTLTATGGNGGSVGNYSCYCGGGAGGAAISGDLTINSGTVTSTNGANGQLGRDTEDCSAGAGCKAVAGTVNDNR